jgi:hypothetical protein
MVVPAGRSTPVFVENHTSFQRECRLVRSWPITSIPEVHGTAAIRRVTALPCEMQLRMRRSEKSLHIAASPTGTRGRLQDHIGPKGHTT